MRPLLLVSLLLALTGAGCAQSPDAGGDSIALARQAYGQGHFSEAEKQYERYLQTEHEGRDRWEAWNRLLEIAVSIVGDNEKGVQLLESMNLEFGEMPARAWIIYSRLAEVQEALRHWNEAIYALQRAKAIPADQRPADAVIQLRMGKIYQKQKEYKQARDILTVCAEQASDTQQRAECLYELALTQDCRHRQRMAQTQVDTPRPGPDVRESVQLIKTPLETLLSLDKVHPETRALATLLLADACASLGENKRALELLQGIRGTYPNPLVVEMRIQTLQGGKRARITGQSPPSR